MPETIKKAHRGFKPIENLFIASVSDDNSTWHYAIRARTEKAATKKLVNKLKENGEENVKELWISISKFRLWQDVTCIYGA